MSSADAAIFMGHTGKSVFVDLPRLIVWEGPKGLFYDLPRKGVLSFRGPEAQAEALIDVISAEDLTVVEQVAISEELQVITGLPLHSTTSWLSWWKSSGKLPAKEWKDAFVSSRIDRLSSPDYFTRASAIEDLKAMYGTTLGYDPKHSSDSIKAGAERWRTRFSAKTLPDPAPGPF